MAVAGYALAFGRVDIDGVNSRDEIEKIASGALVPGMLAKVDTNDKLLAHATEFGRAEHIVVAPDTYRGNGLSETTYAIGDRVKAFIPKKGRRTLALLKDGQNVIKGDFLCSKGDGTLRKVALATDYAVAVADDALDLTAAGANHLLVVRWM